MENRSPGLENLIKAAEDYLFLLNKGYPENPALALTGNRYSLGKTERIMLFRGVCATEKALYRRSRSVNPESGQELHIDGYNLFFTVLNYRLGRSMFLGYDGYLRDAGGTHGRFSQKDLFLSLVEELLLFFKDRRYGPLRIYLDTPVSHSADHAAGIRRHLEALALPGTCETCDSADFQLKKASSGLAVTSDTVIIDSTVLGIYDAARDFLRFRYNPIFFDFKKILS